MLAVFYNRAIKREIRSTDIWFEDGEYFCSVNYEKKAVVRDSDLVFLRMEPDQDTKPADVPADASTPIPVQPAWIDSTLHALSNHPSRQIVAQAVRDLWSWPHFRDKPENAEHRRALQFLTDVVHSTVGSR